MNEWIGYWRLRETIEFFFLFYLVNQISLLNQYTVHLFNHRCFIFHCLLSTYEFSTKHIHIEAHRPKHTSCRIINELILNCYKSNNEFYGLSLYFLIPSGYIWLIQNLLIFRGDLLSGNFNLGRIYVYIPNQMKLPYFCLLYLTFILSIDPQNCPWTWDFHPSFYSHGHS